jgi:hypothetical protein
MARQAGRKRSSRGLLVVVVVLTLAAMTLLVGRTAPSRRMTKEDQAALHIRLAPADDDHPEAKPLKNPVVATPPPSVDPDKDDQVVVLADSQTGPSSTPLPNTEPTFVDTPLPTDKTGAAKRKLGVGQQGTNPPVGTTKPQDSTFMRELRQHVRFEVDSLGNSPPQTHSEAAPERELVLEALRHSWNGYRANAFGYDEYSPKANITRNWSPAGPLGVTMIDALDTLILAGMKAEAKEVIEWMEAHLSFNQSIEVSLFETTIRVLGGLLSSYELSGEQRFRITDDDHKLRNVLIGLATDLGYRLLKAFETPNGIPNNYINLLTGQSHGAAWNGGQAILSEFGSLQLEFHRLAFYAQDPKLKAPVEKCMSIIQKECPKGFCPMYFPREGRPSLATAGLGSMGDSFYEYLVKQHILSKKSPEQSTFYGMWMRAVDHVYATSEYVTIAPSEDTVAHWRAEVESKKALQQGLYNETYEDWRNTPHRLLVLNAMETGHQMEHLACFAGGLFGLSFLQFRDPLHLALAEGLAETCPYMYKAMPSGLSPDVAVLRPQGRTIVASDPKFILRPETVETYFYLWRITGDPKYRTWGREFLIDVNRHLKVQRGYVGASNVVQVPVVPHDNMETFWFAETLKYLLLLFSEDSMVDLQSHVFNTEAHPLRVTPTLR